MQVESDEVDRCLMFLCYHRFECTDNLLKDCRDS